MSCTWDAVPASTIDEVDEVLGYTVLFWTEGDRFETQDETDFPADATSGEISTSASADDKLALQVTIINDGLVFYHITQFFRTYQYFTK